MNYKRKGVISQVIQEMTETTYNKGIEGPMSMSEYWSPLFNKHIYLFGERHNLYTQCSKRYSHRIGFTELLKETLRANENLYPERKIDLYFETAHTNRLIQELAKRERRLPKQEYTQSTIIKTIRDPVFKDCFQMQCGYPNARFHNIDVRQTLQEYQLPVLPEDLVPILESIIYQLEHPQFYNAKRDIETILKYMKDKNIEYSDLFGELERIRNLVKIDKQYTGIQNNDVKSHIYEYFQELYSELEKESYPYNLEQVLEELKTSSSKDTIELLKKYTDVLSRYWMTIVDEYLIARMFRNFGDGSGQEYIIILVGESHAQVYRKIFENLEFKNLDTFKGSGYQCIPLSERQYPLFINQ